MANIRKRSSEAKARSAVAANSDAPLGNECPTDNSGNQFGRNSHKREREKEASDRGAATSQIIIEIIVELFVFYRFKE